MSRRENSLMYPSRWLEEEQKKVKVLMLGWWMVYDHPTKGEVLANIQTIQLLDTNGSMTELEMYFWVQGGVTFFKEQFLSKILISSVGKNVAKMSSVRSSRLRALTDVEVRDLEYYFKGDYAMAINNPLLKEHIKYRLETNTKPTMDKVKYVTPFL